jgi:hypothetical protein
VNALVPPLVDALVGVTQVASEYDASRAERSTRRTRTLLASCTDTVQLQYIACKYDASRARRSTVILSRY